MNGKGNGAVDRAAAEGRAQGLDTGWTVFSYLIGGMIAYGAIGWLIGRAVHVALIFPLGMLLGMAISIAYIIHHYGRGAPGAVNQSPPTGGRGAPGGRGGGQPPVKRGVPGGRPRRASRGSFR
jgi:F0F1-type ATP synthase assembly protein I